MVVQDNIDVAPGSATSGGDTAATIVAATSDVLTTDTISQVCLMTAKEKTPVIHTEVRQQRYVQAGVDMFNLAMMSNARFHFENDRVYCPVLVVRESDEMLFEMARMDVTFGTARARPLMMTSIDIKYDVLSKMQGRPIGSICKDECHGVLVGFKDVECLVLMSLTDTAMRLQEIESGSERHSDAVALQRCLGLLVGLGPYIHPSDDGIIYGFKTKVVGGQSQRVTKNQVRVSQPLWRGLFQGHRVLMAPELLDRVFQNRGRTRSRQEFEAPTPATDTGTDTGTETDIVLGKSPSITSLATKTCAGRALKVVQNEEDPIPQDADQIMETLTTTLEQRRQCIGNDTCEYLKNFVTRYRETVEEDVFIQDLGELSLLNAPEQVLKDRIKEFVEAPQCIDLLNEFN
jgi:hypothetical protein